MLTGLNHLTLAVNDLNRSFSFYVDILGFKPRARWDNGAYLEIGSLWLCLSKDKRVLTLDSDYTHYAFSISRNEFASFKQRLSLHGIQSWKENNSEGESFYFYDLDNHKLEIHVGDLNSRLLECREAPYSGMVIYD